MNRLRKINKIAQNTSVWKENALKRRENRAWQKHAQIIAVKVLRALRTQNIQPKQLAEMMGVSPLQISKILKGQEDLTLQTIAKLSQHLQINLISVEYDK